MTDVMQGVRILEVAEHTFVPAASALLADWGAEVIKIEHVERGDAMRGLASTGVAVMMNSDVHVLLEHSNRGKKSLALDLASEEGLAILHQLAATCDVFLTNKLPSVRTKLKVDVEDIRAHNPNIIYVRGTGQGERGPDADRGSYDILSYWHRSGIAMGVKQADHIPPPPAPAFGDSIGAMTIAGGIMGALYHREKTGEATTVDVSLLGIGIWSMGAAMALSLQLDRPWAPPPPGGGATQNPIVGAYEAQDGTFVSFSCLQAARYWGELCGLLGRPELATDERFRDAVVLRENAPAAADIIREIIASRPADEWRQVLEPFSGQWTIVQDTLQAAADPQTVANGYIVDCATSSGAPFKLAGAPVQYDGVAPQARRAPEFNEHGDEILESLGLDMDAIVDLKVRGIVA